MYLNNAATGWPRAPGVVEAVAEALSAPPAHPGRAAGRVADFRSECRARTAALLGVGDPTRIVLTTHATHALNLAIRGLDLPPGARVVTTVTEHNSVLRPLNHLRAERGLRITIVGLDAGGAIDTAAFAAALAQQPALVAINHASNVTGHIADVGPLFARAKDAGATTLLDASQSLGHVPIQPDSLGADLIAFTGHKGLHGPPGVGGLYVAPHIELAQVYVGGTGVRSDLELHPAEMPTRLEAGTPNIPALAGFAAALRWHEVNAAQSRRRETELARRLRSGLRGVLGVEICGAGRGRRAARRRIAACAGLGRRRGRLRAAGELRNSLSHGAALCPTHPRGYRDASRRHDSLQLVGVQYR